MKEKSEPRMARSHTVRARHTALLVKALNAGQTMPGVICQKQTKKKEKEKFSRLFFFKGTLRGRGHLNFFPLWATFIWENFIMATGS